MSRAGTLAADLLEWPDRIALLQQVCDAESIRRKDLVATYIDAHPSDDDAQADVRSHLTVLEHRDAIWLEYRDDHWHVKSTGPGRRILARARHSAGSGKAASS
jgi:hypothetical protein